MDIWIIIDGWTDVLMDGQADGFMDGRRSRGKVCVRWDGWTGGRSYRRGWMMIVKIDSRTDNGVTMSGLTIAAGQMD